jgi:hypothetical protein
VAQMGQIKKKNKDEKKRVFVCFYCKIIDLFLRDPHLSSFDGGRGAPVGYMFQMKEKKKRKLDILLFSFRYSI